MPERLTVVFDDDMLYRRLKVRAAEESVPIKKLIEDAVREYLGPGEEPEKAFDWDAFDRWQSEVETIGRESVPIPIRPEYAAFAEEKATYNSGE
jgi:hypothetical protein